MLAAPEPGTSVPFAVPVTVAGQSDDARDPEELAALARPTPVPVAHPSCSAQWGSSVPVPGGRPPGSLWFRPRGTKLLGGSREVFEWTCAPLLGGKCRHWGGQAGGPHLLSFGQPPA